MKIKKNKVIKGIKILANGPLYSVLLAVPSGSNCFENKKKEITTIASPSRAEKLVIADEDNDVLKQPHAEEVYAVSEKQLKAGLEGNNKTNQEPVPVENDDLRSSNRCNGQSNQKQLKAGLEGNNETNQEPVPVENGDLRSSNICNGQSNQGVNSQSQIISDVPNKDKKSNEEPSHFNTSMQELEDISKQDISTDQNPTPILRASKKDTISLKETEKEELIKKIDCLKKETEKWVTEYIKLCDCNGEKVKKDTLNGIKDFYKEFTSSSLTIDRIIKQPKEEQEGSIDAIILVPGNKYIEKLKKYINDIKACETKV